MYDQTRMIETVTEIDLPKFGNPPVVETALSVQFERIPGLTDAHVGAYWRDVLGPEWASITPVQRLANATLQTWGTPPPEIIHPGVGQRWQIVQPSNNRMIQVQDTRFAYNWRRFESEDYPSYDKVLPEFRLEFARFRAFVDTLFGPMAVKPTQWEVIYVNHIPQSDLWNTPHDWNNVLPWFSSPTSPVGKVQTFGGNWTLELSGGCKLSIQVQHAKRNTDDKEIIVLKLLARGPTDSSDPSEAMETGHTAIVQTFASITSHEAHSQWKRQQ